MSRNGEMTKIQTQLLKLAQIGDLDVLKTFIGNNFSDDSWLTYYNKKCGDTVSILAARFGHLQILRYLHDEIQCLDVSQRNFDGKTLLHEAAHFGHVVCVQYLLTNGANVDSIKKADWTPLMLACTRHNLDVIRILIKHGASTRLVNKDGWNSFHIACREGNSDIVNFLLDYDENLWKSCSKNGRISLHTAALHGCTDVVRLLLTRCRYDIDVTDSCGNTSLMDAARGGHVATVKLLLEYRADVNKEDKLGRQCLHIAAESGQQSVIRYLTEEYRLDINIPSHVGQTLLHYSAKEGHYKLVSYLIQNGCDVLKTDHKTRTALHLASGGQHGECVKLLLQKSNLDPPDVYGITARDLAKNSNVISIFDSFS